jgi:hypothetical protein
MNLNLTAKTAVVTGPAGHRTRILIEEVGAGRPGTP